MSKEYLKALGFIKSLLKDDWVDSVWKPYYETIKQALQRLETIDNAKPSEALECLEYISKEEIVVRDRNSIYMNPNDNNKGAFTHLTTVGVNFKGALEHIKQALIKSQEQEKALKIMFEKYVDLNLLDCDDEVGQYNRHFGKGRQLTEEEFELLKRNLI